MSNTFKTTTDFLNNNQYSDEGIQAYEFIYGKDFISSGGLNGTIKILSDINLNENSKVLDIGSGLGGGCKYINEKYGSYTYGIDLCEKMVNIAKSRNIGNKKIEFENVDALKKCFPENTFDFIYTRDSLLHLSIENKKLLFKNCYKWLKPNGIILVTDYCASTKENWDKEFEEYIKKRQYTLITIEEYSNLITSSNFKNVVAKDISDLWLELLEAEINTLKEKKEEFLKKNSEEKYNDLIEGWNRKIKDSKRKIQLWGYFKATKC